MLAVLSHGSKTTLLLLAEAMTRDTAVAAAAHAWWASVWWVLHLVAELATYAALFRSGLKESVKMEWEGRIGHAPAHFGNLLPAMISNLHSQVARAHAD